MIYDRNIVNNNIRALINDNNISQYDLAQIVGTHQSRISECLSGKKDFTLPQLFSLAEYFNVSIDLLVGRQDSSLYHINTLSDICQILFLLEQELDITIVHEYVPEFNDDSPLPPNSVPSHTSAHAGHLCVLFRNKHIREFLSEWKDARLIRFMQNGNSLYKTWQNGVLQHYKKHFAKYNYQEKDEYQCELYNDYYSIYPDCLEHISSDDVSLLNDFLIEHPEKDIDGKYKALSSYSHK